MIVIINGPSGSGKTTLGEYFKTLGMQEIVSTTTRKMRPGEVQGVSYYFVEEEAFFQKERIEESEYAGHYYAVTKEEVEAKRALGVPLFASLDIRGVKAMKALYGPEVLVVYLKLSRTKLKERMAKRGDSIASIRSRLAHHRATREDLNEQYADYVLWNNGSPQKLYRQARRILEQEGIVTSSQGIAPRSSKS
ncbi:Guanylate kinase [Clostridiaceae bacterium JG1575]|nr:Guanylate kinase [Clostridiaceae bacterium JG1575]